MTSNFRDSAHKTLTWRKPSDCPASLSNFWLSQRDANGLLDKNLAGFLLRRDWDCLYRRRWDWKCKRRESCLTFLTEESYTNFVLAWGTP